MKKNSISYLVGSEDIQNAVMEPYNEVAIEFLNALSAKLLKHKNYSDVISLGYFCRKANIIKLKSEYEDEKIRLGRGIVFHVTPSNVPVNFAFSFVFGLLAGCANIVRVPSKPYAQTTIICNEINEVFKTEKFCSIKKSTAFVFYEADNEITSMFSTLASGRILWGGDNTVNHIKGLPSSSQCVDIAFSDRYSFMVIDSDKVIGSEESELSVLAKNFYNDTFFIDQNACSSPHLIVWVGENISKAKSFFWDYVHKEAQKYPLEPIKVMDKYNLLLTNALDYKEIESVEKIDNLIYRVKLNALFQNIENCRGKFGLFYEYDCNNLKKIAGIVNSKFQTITYFGELKEQLKTEIMESRLSGVDRIVPVGQALSIKVIWDGYDIVKTLSRIITIE